MRLISEQRRERGGNVMQMSFLLLFFSILSLMQMLFLLGFQTLRVIKERCRRHQWRKQTLKLKKKLGAKQKPRAWVVNQSFRDVKKKNKMPLRSDSRAAIFAT